MLPKSSLFFKWFIAAAFSISALFTTSLSFAQNKIPADAKCYVVVGAFNLERNASLFKSFLEQKNLTATYRKNTYRNMYYVYTFESRDREATKEKLFNLRKTHPQLTDSWLYAGNFRGPHIPSDQWYTDDIPKEKEVIAQAEERSLTAKETTEEYVDDNTSELENDSLEEEIIEEQKDVVEKTAEAKEEQKDVVEKTAEAKEEIHEVEESPKAAEVVSAPPLKEDQHRIYINAYDGTSLQEVSGSFITFDTERFKEIGSINTHEATIIDKPANATNRITIKSDLFDYKVVEHTIDLDEPETDGEGIVEMVGDTILVNFPMKRHEKGDIMVMWQVFFFKDAAIMKEESIGQLNQLLRMLQTNPEMRVMIHGHTNGNSHGKVLYLSDGDLDFFSLKSSSHEEINASAKKLSEFRAYTIQHWLMDQGISEDRIEIKGWGGKKMIYGKHDTQAHKNVRVEIEVIDEGNG